MGCGILKKPTIVINSVIETPKTQAELQPNEITVNQLRTAKKYFSLFSHKSYFHKISMHSLVNIIDYLSFMELRQVGKVNKLFNQISKQDIILIKFFKKKKTIKLPNKTIITFAALQMNKSNSYSTSQDER